MYELKLRFLPCVKQLIYNKKYNSISQLRELTILLLDKYINSKASVSNIYEHRKKKGRHDFTRITITHVNQNLVRFCYLRMKSDRDYKCSDILHTFLPPVQSFTARARNSNHPYFLCVPFVRKRTLPYLFQELARYRTNFRLIQSDSLSLVTSSLASTL